MELKICKDSEEMAHETSSWCVDKIKTTQAQSLYLPAGNTPIPVYQHWTKNPPDFLSQLQLIQIDDVVTGSKAGIFKQFLIQHLPKQKDHFRWIGEQYNQGDLAILGLGLNGHIAFHEPELPKNFYSGCVRLSDKTCETLKIEPSTWGVTYGASAFLETKAILILVSGVGKQEVLQRFLKKDPTLPASALHEHKDFTILADRAAAGN